MAIHAVILDIDGTLIDSNDAHARAWVNALAEYGYPASLERVRTLIGMGGDKVLPEITGVQQNSLEGKQISERRAQIFKERYLPQVQGLPGAHELLQRLNDEGLSLVVATSANQDEVEALLRIVGADDLITEHTTASDVKQSKPDPDVVQVALERLGQPADRVIMIGDTPWDVQAATRAGVQIIALRSGGWSDSALEGARAIYQDPADLLAHYQASPLGDAGDALHVER